MSDFLLSPSTPAPSFPWETDPRASRVTFASLCSPQDPELTETESACIVEHLCAARTDTSLLRYLSSLNFGNLLSRASEPHASLPSTPASWSSHFAPASTQSRCVGSVMSMLLADGLGHATEFQQVDMGRKMPGMPDASYAPQPRPRREWVPWLAEEYRDGKAGVLGQFLLKPGQWTDDSSMGLCILDSLLATKTGFDALDCMTRFVLWTKLGLNNAFGYDYDRRRDSMWGCGSVGLGGNISMSIDMFMRHPSGVTSAGDYNTCGNGSVMRLSPVAVRFFRDPTRAMDVAEESSVTTHQGIEASMCCRLLAFIISFMISPPPSASGCARNSQEDFRRLLDVALAQFCSLPPPACDPSQPDRQAAHDAAVAAVDALAKSQTQNENRDWNWRNAGFRYSPERVRVQRGYVGSYCMDAMAMALYRCYHSSDYQDAILRAAGMGGDADSVGSIVGQILGAFYGHDAIPFAWMQAVWRWDQGSAMRRTEELHTLAVADDE